MKLASKIISGATAACSLLAAALWFWVSAKPYELTLDSLVPDLQNMADWNKAAALFTGLAIILGLIAGRLAPR